MTTSMDGSPARCVKYEFTASFQEPQTQTTWVRESAPIFIDDTRRKGILYLWWSTIAPGREANLLLDYAFSFLRRTITITCAETVAGDDSPRLWEDHMAGFMMRPPKIVSVAIVALCLDLTRPTPAIPSLSGSVQEVAQPASPQSPDAKPKTHSVNLNWKASTSTVVGYNVYGAEKSEGPFRKLNSSPTVKTNYEDTEVRGGHTYYYKVAAVDAKGKESESTTQIQAVVPYP
jgi:hypothetical protein